MLISLHPSALIQRATRGKLSNRWKWHVIGPQPPSWMDVFTSSAVLCARVQTTDSKWRMQSKCTIQIATNGFYWHRCAVLRCDIRWLLRMGFYLRSLVIVRNMSRWKTAGQLYVRLHQELAIQIIHSNTFQFHVSVHVNAGVNVDGDIIAMPSYMQIGKLTFGESNKWFPFSKSKADRLDLSINRFTLFHD